MVLWATLKIKIKGWADTTKYKEVTLETNYFQRGLLQILGDTRSVFRKAMDCGKGNGICGAKMLSGIWPPFFMGVVYDIKHLQQKRTASVTRTVVAYWFIHQIPVKTFCFTAAGSCDVEPDPEEFPVPSSTQEYNTRKFLLLRLSKILRWEG